MKKIICSLLLALPVVTNAMTFESAPGESMDAFVYGIVSDTHKATIKAKAELCGIIQTNGQRYKLTLTTIGREDECYVEVPKIEGQWSSTGVSFHTHLIKHGLRLSDADYKNPGYMARGKIVIHQQGRGTERWVKAP